MICRKIAPFLSSIIISFWHNVIDKFLHIHKFYECINWCINAAKVILKMHL